MQVRWEYEYGTATLVRFERLNSRGYVRVHSYRSKADGQRVLESIHVTNEQDDSPMQCGGYDARCSWCWLNIPHTEKLHRLRVQTRAARTA